jgi:hypothetical protein
MDGDAAQPATRMIAKVRARLTPNESNSIRPAVRSDLDAVIGLRTEAERWLRERRIRQWTADYDEYARGVLADWVHSGAAWVVEHDGKVVATVSVNGPDPDFWGWADDQADAHHLER